MLKDVKQHTETKCIEIFVYQKNEGNHIFFRPPDSSKNAAAQIVNKYDNITSLLILIWIVVKIRGLFRTLSNI